MYRNILVPVAIDDDARTQTALEVVKALADPDASVTLLHVIETIPIYVSDYIPNDFMTNAREAAAQHLDGLAQQVPNAHAAITDGRPGSRITRWAEENNCDCIVIASHQPAFTDILLGSVAQHVVRHAVCSVHVVR